MISVTFGAQLTGLVLIAGAIWVFPDAPRRGIALGSPRGCAAAPASAALSRALDRQDGRRFARDRGDRSALPGRRRFRARRTAGLWQCVGFGVALLAVVLISYSREETGEREISTAGVKEAIAAGVVIGGFLLFLSFAHKSAGMWPLAAARVGAVALLATLGLATGTSLRAPNAVLRLVVLAGAIDMFATCCTS